MNLRLARLGSLMAGYVAVLMLDRSWQLLEQRAQVVADAAQVADDALASLEDDDDGLEPADVSDVVARHDCVCCRTGAASGPPAAAEGAA